MDNIAAASLLFPSLSGLARRSKISPSRLVMPLAFGTILGGMVTLLTITNIIVSGLLRDERLPGFGLPVSTSLMPAIIVPLYFLPLH